MKTLINDRIDNLVSKAKQGDFSSQYKLAQYFYYGKLVERSIPLARYWAFKAITNKDSDHNTKLYNFYRSTKAPHFTGNEEYVSFGEPYDINLNNGGIGGSSKFRGKFDVLSDDEHYYRTYLIARFILLYFIIGAYRVYEPQQGSYHIYGKEKTHFKEYWKWLIPFFLLVVVILICIVV